MTRYAVAAILILILPGCVIGPSASKFAPAQTGQGIVVRVTLRTSVVNPDYRSFTAEVLEIREDGLLLRRYLGPRSESIARVSYGVIGTATFEELSRLNFSSASPPSPSQREQLRLLSRYPQGVSEELLDRLLAAYNQENLRVFL